MIFQEFNQYKLVDLNIKSDFRFKSTGEAIYFFVISVSFIV